MELTDEVVLKDGTTGTIVEFDTGSPLGYDICIRSSIGDGQTVRRWIRKDDIAGDDRTAADFADANPVTE